VILRDSAYLHELSGRRLDQARENVKKLRALIRRVENRGYATLGRLAEYFDTLRAGDDSNAVIEAAGAVNLMTIHAAKGLEFPVVFLVNVQTPGRGGHVECLGHRARPIGRTRCQLRSSPATKLELRRETEELRRCCTSPSPGARPAVLWGGSEGRQIAAGRAQPCLAHAGFARESVRRDGPVEFRCRGGLGQRPWSIHVSRLPRTRRRGQRARVARRADRHRFGRRRGTGRARPARGGGDRCPRNRCRPHRRSNSAAARSRPYDERLLGTIVHRLLQRRIDPSLTTRPWRTSF
jgi:hypothetical protein